MNGSRIRKLYVDRPGPTPNTERDPLGLAEGAHQHAPLAHSDRQTGTAARAEEAQ